MRSTGTGFSAVRSLTLALAAFSAASLPCASAADIETRLRALEEQNRKLAETVQAQQRTISDLQNRLDGGNTRNETEEGSSNSGGFNIGNVHLSGEGAVGFFHTGPDGAFPNGDFRADEAKLFVEAPLWNETYFFGELNLITRETNEEFFQLGELYVDFENVSRILNRDRWLNLRAGRIDIPFGEEYLVRDAIDNPLISHSLSDIWGVDEGIEAYGTVGKIAYVLAVQNGGHPTLNDHDADKSVAARLSYDPLPWLHLSGSAMRTGDLDVNGDKLSEVWIGDGFFRAVGSEQDTTRFEANLYELDIQTFWKSGHLKLAGGYIQYDDDDATGDRRRDAWYHYVEAKQNLVRKLYAAGRFSQIISDKGLPLVGHGRYGSFFYGPLTTDIWRLSAGVGYQFSENLVTKLEYSFEERQTFGNSFSIHENFIGAQVGFKF